MTPKFSKEELNSFEYVYNVLEKDNMYYVQIPELSILVSDSSLESAFLKVKQRKNELFELAINSNSFSTINPPDNLIGDKGVRNKVMIFFYKMLIFSIFISLVGFLFFPTIHRLNNSIDKTIEKNIKRAFNRGPIKVQIIKED